MKTSHSHNSGGTIADVAGERAKEYVDAGVDAYNAASDKTRAMTRQMQGYIRTNPWPMIGLAAGAGFLAGLMLRRR